MLQDHYFRSGFVSSHDCLFGIVSSIQAKYLDLQPCYALFACTRFLFSARFQVWRRQLSTVFGRVSWVIWSHWSFCRFLVSSLCSAVRVDCLVSKRNIFAETCRVSFPFSLRFFTTCHVLLGFPVQPSLSRLPGSRVKNSLSTQVIAKRLLSQSYRSQIFSQTTSFPFQELSLTFIPWFMPSSSPFSKIIHDVVFVQKEELLSIQETSSQVLVCLADSSFSWESVPFYLLFTFRGSKRKATSDSGQDVSWKRQIRNLQSKLFSSPSLPYKSSLRQHQKSQEFVTTIHFFEVSAIANNKISLRIQTKKPTFQSPSQFCMKSLDLVWTSLQPQDEDITSRTQ